MTSDPNAWVDCIEGFTTRPKTAQVLLIAYYLQFVEGQAAFSPSQVAAVFDRVNVRTPGNVRRVLLGLADRGTLLRPITGSYRFSRDGIAYARSLLGDSVVVQQRSQQLRDVVGLVASSLERVFAEEAVQCWEVGALRSSVVMTWCLAMSHMYNYILTQHLSDFNQALKRTVPSATVRKYDDFLELSEDKFLEVLRTGRLVTKDVDRILRHALGFRNTCAHPNDVTVPAEKVSALIQDIVVNVIAKYAP